MPKTNQERLREAEATRAAAHGQMQAIMDAADEKGETLDAEQDAKFTEHKAKVDELDKHIGRLQDMERIHVSKALPVVGTTSEAAAQSRNGTGLSPIIVRSREVEKWRPLVRYTMAKMAQAAGMGNAYDLFRSREQWMAETPEVADILKAAVQFGTTTDSVWAGPLVQYQVMAQNFAEFLYPMTIIGRIQGFTRVPFKVRVPVQTQGATVNWVGEGAPKPLTSLAFTTVTLDFAKIAGIIPLTEELVRASSPAVETIVRDSLASSITKFMDSQFVDPTKAADANSPASIINGITPIVPTGTTGAALIKDINTLLTTFLANNLSLGSATWIMTQRLALQIGSIQNSLGQQMFPGLTKDGGTLAGIPVVASENIPSTTGSPAEGSPMILLLASEVLMADDGQVTIDASREASLQMESAPDSPVTGSTVMVSLWQQNAIAIKAERFINWRLRRANAAAYISSAVYTG
jgi:HK97 family phage major capsid protein